MEYITYLVYPILLFIFLWGAKRVKKGEWNDEAFSLRQTKAIQGFAAICIMLHHVGQKTSASWLDPKMIIPGLEPFVRPSYYFVGIFLFCSGYGLYKSYLSKENYLKGFVKKRVLPLIFMSYFMGLVFFIVRVIVGEKMTWNSLLMYITQWKLCNVNGWFVIILPFFYLIFYFTFRFIKNKRVAFAINIAAVFLYVLVGTMIDHNDGYLFRGQWWYESIHFYAIGLIFAKYEKKILAGIKKNYWKYLIISLLLIYPLYKLTELTNNVFSYYGETFPCNDKVLRRWICYLSENIASFTFVYFIMTLGMKLKIGNKILDFMGKLTLEFYLVHGLFVELFCSAAIGCFGHCYVGLNIRNIPLFILAVTIPSIPLSMLMHKLLVWFKKKL